MQLEKYWGKKLLKVSLLIYFYIHIYNDPLKPVPKNLKENISWNNIVQFLKEALDIEQVSQDALKSKTLEHALYYGEMIRYICINL